jgi:small-conductance mechanosensitive channel/CRP-like cAMP-binding protein
MHPALHEVAAALGGLLLTLIALRWIPERRGSARALAALLGVGLLAAVVSRWAEPFVRPEGAGMVVREASLLLLAVALFGLSVMVLVRLVFRRAKLPIVFEHLLLVLLLFFYVLFRMYHRGVDLSSLVTTSAVFTAIFALASQETLSNLFGGIALQLERTLRVGDWVRSGTALGRVIEVRFRSTVLETAGGERIVVPNAELLKGRVTVVGSSGGRPGPWRRTTEFVAGFDVHPDRVTATVEAALADVTIEGVAPDRPARCYVRAVDPNGIRYLVGYWVADVSRYETIDSRMIVHVVAALQREGIAIAVPLESVSLSIDDDAARERAARRELEARVAALQRQEAFALLEPAEVAALATTAQVHRYADGDAVTRQGDHSRTLLVLRSGAVDVYVNGVGGKTGPVHVARREAPAVFGEYALLTGEPRSATLIARGAAECLQIGEESVRHMLQARPELAESLAAMLVERQRATETALDAATQAEAAEKRRSATAELVGKIRRLFSLGAARRTGESGGTARRGSEPGGAARR